jgi:NAD(P)-dependent dehydrogenase (short-subunit alcohol dehydrogenase family)
MSPAQHDSDPGRRPVALVTGASRGIGKATALALATAGFDVALTARTRREGDGKESGDGGEGRTLPGSLDTTSAEVEQRGGRALALVADLHEPATLLSAAAQTVDAWGGIDLLVNNAIDTGPGSMRRFLETTAEQFRTKVEANYLAQLELIRAVLPGMLERGSGVIVNMTSYAASHAPPAPPGEGGWGLAYAASKAAFERVAGALHVEFGGQGILAVNVDPGHVVTETQELRRQTSGLDGRYDETPASAPASAIAWLATSPDAWQYAGTTVSGLRIALREAGHPDWRRR